MDDKRPRYFFGLLCAHKWAVIGEKNITDGLHQTQSLVLQCEYCGNIKHRR